MVKCKALILKYMSEGGRTAVSFEGGRCSSQFLTKSGYIPTWRSVCEQWIQEALEEKEGEVTPVYVLYNAYLKDNPDRYLDIAQFGKILKSRFKNRKCRRGKQGAQIYVYKNVIIKPKAGRTVSQEAQQGCNLKDQSFDHYSSSDYGLFNGTQSIADPFGELGLTEPSSSKLLPPDGFCSVKYGSFNDRQSIPGHAQADMTPRLHSGASSANSIMEETSSPLDLRLPAVLARRKLLSSNPCEHSNYKNTKNSKTNVQDVLESQYHNREEDDRSVCSSLSELSSLVKDSDGNSENGENLHDSVDKSSDFVLVDKHVTASSSKYHNEYVFCNRDDISPKKSMLLDVEVKDIEVEEESCLHLDIDQTDTKSIIENYFRDDSQSTESDEQSNVEMMEDHIVFRLEGEELQEIAPIEFSEEPVREEARNAPRSIGGQTAAKVDSLSRTATETNRMALGRRWVDSNLRDQPGKRTFPWEIAAAYARDHPEEPLTDTNFAVLIRSKFPSRRKKMNHGPKTFYYYQDLELTNPSQLPNTSPILRETTPEGQVLAPNVPAILMSGDGGAPVAVLNPPAESVFTMNGKPYVSLKIVDLPSNTSSAGPSNSKRQRTRSYEVVPNCTIQNEAPGESIVNHTRNARVLESSSGAPDKSSNDMQITVQNLPEDDGMFSQGTASPEHPVRDQSLSSGDEGMFSQGTASPEHPVRDQSISGDEGMFSQGTASPEHPVRDQSLSSGDEGMFSQGTAPPEHPVRDQSLSGDEGMFSQGTTSPEHPVRDQSLSGDEGMFGQGTASPEHPVRDQSISGGEGMFSQGTASPEHPVRDQSLSSGDEGMFGQGTASLEQPVRDQSLSGDEEMFSQGTASPEQPVRDRRDTRDDGMFRKGTASPERPVADVSPSAFSQNLVDAIKAEPMDTETDLLLDIVPEDVKTNPVLMKMDMAVSDYIHGEMFNEIYSHAHDNRYTTSQMSADQVSRETEENTNSIAKRNYLSDVTSKSRKHNVKSNIRNPSPYSTNNGTNKSILNFHNLFSLKQRLSRSSASLKNWRGGRLSQTFDTSCKSPRPKDFKAKKRSNLDGYKRLNGNSNKSLTSNPRKMVVLEHRKRKVKTKRWGAAVQTEAVQNILCVNEVLQVAFHFFSAGSGLSEAVRARRLEATIYRSNPAVSYGEPPSPSSETNSYACQTSSRFIESSKTLTYSKVTSLLRHHQTCQGLGCSYSSDLCLTLRAMYTHITIFSHRCQVWGHFTDLVGRHARSCRQRDCQLAFCLYMKHELHLTNAGAMSDDDDEEERDDLRKEFDRCESHGPHDARLHCGHLPRVQIPLGEKVEAGRTQEYPLKDEAGRTQEYPLKDEAGRTQEYPLKDEAGKTQEYPLKDEVEARTLKLLGNFALPGASPAFVTPIINALSVTADMFRTCTSEAE
ncbi:uncharacterized protein [Penaeus vannamei]|uniref:uncharacterized protein isoform X1 n=1 Tax=Penaeus vannamei TaxID=6689 RepID=UPI00387F85F9